MERKFTETTVSSGNIEIAEGKDFIALHFAQEGAQGSMCEINALDINGDLYKFSFNCFAENYIPLNTLLNRFFLFLKYFDFVTLSGRELFKRHLFGNDNTSPNSDCGWVNAYLGCMNHLVIRKDICEYLAETAEEDLALIDDRDPLRAWIVSLRTEISKGKLDKFKNSRF